MVMLYIRKCAFSKNPHNEMIYFQNKCPCINHYFSFNYLLFLLDDKNRLECLMVSYSINDLLKCETW